VPINQSESPPVIRTQDRTAVDATARAYDAAALAWGEEHPVSRRLLDIMKDAASEAASRKLPAAHPAARPTNEPTPVQLGKWSEFAIVLYEDHPAAFPLLVEAFSGDSAERRARSWYALQALDPDNPVPRPGDNLAAPVGEAVVSALRSAADSDRARLVRELHAFLDSANVMTADRFRVVGDLQASLKPATRATAQQEAA